ncbi:winged helix-turn-helix transcriptional regulator [Limnofasciculus baicalensis]|uniref:winged helix-turn-helix transcriptional regulator n=1 Tax=Limnofasciculus baicalensis TaxID=3064906 RepID=UPI0028159B70|nr:winged helix-turn-helix transcriptional regulator [Limnofasciculus baicalensis]
MADKWSVMLIYALSKQETIPYSELHRMIGGISQKMLTQTGALNQRLPSFIQTIYDFRRVEYNFLMFWKISLTKAHRHLS